MALEMHLPPSVVWKMDPKDLSTVVDLMNERGEKVKRASRRR